MFDSLSNYFEQNNQRLADEGVRPGQMNAAGMAGYLMSTGMMPQDAYIQAARMTREQEMSNLERQKYEQQQQQALQLAQMLQGGDASGNFDQMSPQQKMGMMIQSGVRPEAAAAMAQAMTPNPLQNTFKGAGGMLYQAGTNPETGQLESRIIPGQAPEFQPLSAAEKRAQATEKAEFARAAAGGTKELRILEDMEKAFEGFDKHSGGTGIAAGGFLASTKKIPGILNEEQTNALIYNKDQLKYKNEIDKLNSQLYQARLSSVPAKMATDAFKSELEKGLPRVSIVPEARKEIIASKKREIVQSIVRNKFFNDWEKLNHGDRTGAEDALRQLEQEYDYLDENNKPNKVLMKNLPKIVQQLYMQESTDNGMSSAQPMQPDNLMNEDEFGDQLNDEGFLNYLERNAQR